MSEPLLTEPNGKGTGRPKITEEQYRIWLEELRPFLQNSNSIYYSSQRSGLENKYDTILEKYKLGDWFSKKVDAYRAEPGELVNDSYTMLVRNINDKIKRKETIDDEERKVLEHFSKTHRTAQPFFVTRTETAEAKDEDIGKILDIIEATDYEQLGREVKEQTVANDAPVQNQEQAGSDSDVQS